MNQTNDPVRLLVAGAGRIGELHARNILERIPAFSLAGIVEPYPNERVSQWAAIKGISLYCDLETAMEGCRPQAVLVAAPTDLHEKTALTAIAAGLPVFCEKPVASDIPSARRMIAAAAKAGVPLQIGFNRRFDRNFAALRRAVHDGTLGRPEMIRVTSRDPGPPPLDYIKRSGGIFNDMTIHDFDMVRFLSGSDFTEVQVTGAALVDSAIGDAGDIDSAVIMFTMVNGVIGFIENSRRAAYGYDQRAEVLGSLGAAAIGNEKPDTLTVSSSSGVSESKPLHFFLERYGESFVTELECFAESVNTGSPVPIDGANGLEAMRVAEACRIALREGRKVLLSEIL